MRLSAKHAPCVVTNNRHVPVPPRNKGWSWPLALYSEAVPKGAARHPLSASAEVAMVLLPCGRAALLAILTKPPAVCSRQRVPQQVIWVGSRPGVEETVRVDTDALARALGVGRLYGSRRRPW